MKKKLKIRIGNLAQGWRPISVSNGESSIDIVASTVPTDPLIRLIEATERSCIQGIESEAWMHLEPHFYKWQFVPDSDSLTLSLYFVEQFDSITMPGNTEHKETLELSYQGSLGESLLSIWRALKEIASSEDHYEEALLPIQSTVNELKSLAARS